MPNQVARTLKLTFKGTLLAFRGNIESHRVSWWEHCEGKTLGRHDQLSKLGRDVKHTYLA
jgi:hypothetical protein